MRSVSPRLKELNMQSQTTRPPTNQPIQPVHMFPAFILTDPDMLRGPYYDDLTKTIRIPARLCHNVITPLANAFWQNSLKCKWDGKTREWCKVITTDEVPEILKICILVFDFFWDIDRHEVGPSQK